MIHGCTQSHLDVLHYSYPIGCKPALQAIRNQGPWLPTEAVHLDCAKTRGFCSLDAGCTPRIRPDRGPTIGFCGILKEMKLVRRYTRVASKLHTCARITANEELETTQHH